MRRLVVFCLAAVVVVSSVRPAEAGRRSGRRARGAATAATAATATYAAAAATPVYAPVVAATPVVAAAPVAAVNVPVSRPDLTIVEMASLGDVQTIVVKNIGQAASAKTRLRVDFCRPSDGAAVASTMAVMAPLEVNQTVRVRVHWLPTARLQAIAVVDPDGLVAENDEANNLRAILVGEAPVAPRTALEDVNVEASAVKVTAL
jgi:hypothetical protein